MKLFNSEEFLYLKNSTQDVDCDTKINDDLFKKIVGEIDLTLEQFDTMNIVELCKYTKTFHKKKERKQKLININNSN